MSSANYTEAELREQVRVLTDAVAMWKGSNSRWRADFKRERNRRKWLAERIKLLRLVEPGWWAYMNSMKAIHVAEHMSAKPLTNSSRAAREDGLERVGWQNDD